MHMNAPPALSAPSTIATLTQQRDQLRTAYHTEQRDLLERSRETHNLFQRWQLEGSPGSNFTSWLGGEAGEYIPHGTVQDRLRSGEAQAAGVVVGTDTEGQNAGRELRALTSQGLPLAQAVVEVNKKAAAGGLKKRRTPGAPEGCTFRAVPLTVVDALDGLLRRLPEPCGAPEGLAIIIEAVANLNGETLAALLGGGEHVLIRASDLQELIKRAGL